MTTIQTNLCQASSSTTCAVGLSPCSPPSASPRMQRSPGPIYSPTFVQTGLSSPPSTSPFHDQLDMVPLTPSVHSPLTIPTRDAGLQPTISCGSYETYGPSAQEMNTNILQIVEQLMSPASSEPNAPPPYSCSDVVPLYTTAPCDSTSPDGPAFTGNTLCHLYHMPVTALLLTDNAAYISVYNVLTSVWFFLYRYGNSDSKSSHGLTGRGPDLSK